MNNCLRNILKETSHSNAAITKFGSDQEIIIRITGSNSSLGNDIGEELKTTLANTGNFEIRRVDMVGAKVGGELAEKGLMSLLLSFIGIIIYVSFRFNWKFALVSLLALVHDVIIAIGAVSLFNVEVNLDILAAILTLLGYSLNDTIIIFDRIREVIQTTKEDDLEKLIDDSVSRTLPRTVLTSLTVFFTVLTLYLFGGEIINGFAFTMLVGVIVGTYSSIFVASSFLVNFRFSIADYRAKEVEIIRVKKEKAKNRYTEAKDLRKELQDEIKTLEKRKFDIGDNKESKIVYNGKTVKLSEAQAGLDDEISILKNKLLKLE